MTEYEELCELKALLTKKDQIIQSLAARIDAQAEILSQRIGNARPRDARLYVDIARAYELLTWYISQSRSFRSKKTSRHIQKCIAITQSTFAWILGKVYEGDPIGVTLDEIQQAYLEEAGSHE